MKKDIIMSNIVSMETIVSKIYMIRGLKVMLDRDLAELYGVETKQLKRAVRRNIDRFLLILCSNLQKRSWSIGGAKLAPPIVIRWD